MRSTLDIALPPLMGRFKPDRSSGSCIFVYLSLASGKISSSSPAVQQSSSPAVQQSSSPAVVNSNLAFDKVFIKGIVTRWHLNTGNLYGGFSSVYRL